MGHPDIYPWVSWARRQGAGTRGWAPGRVGVRDASWEAGARGPAWTGVGYIEAEALIAAEALFVAARVAGWDGRSG